MADIDSPVPAETFVHPSSIIEDGAQLGQGVRIGPFCHIGPRVSLGDGVEVKSHAVITGDTAIGAETTVFPFACIGEAPQDLKFKGENTRLVIGARNRIREYVTMNPGTEGGGGVTTVGDDGLFMAGSHVAHDCRIGDRVILVNNVAIAGHCDLGDDVIVGGLSGVHQFVRIGRGAMIGAVTMVTADVLPFGLVQGPRGHLDGLNLVGLRRRGAGRADIAALRDLLSDLDKGNFREAARERADSTAVNPMVREVLDFILGPTDRSFLTSHS
ncbi:MAG: acyl-[acyl-carrier-protein]--UDP-N-acetylglucosamine O-acyltransferase [Paracoccus denitrificans]|nr:MAG: acyl-[acyl-carrier-protein]--UDP-N-acetylglucosamine O-acyltransferase [Paracoccus denitrificans]PZO84453.1 MAG: acyl-[acyl-carrier-protein]--UDP-N-acetylglucosamine O-acyltransferase [Paracoccus denitrificans]